MGMFDRIYDERGAEWQTKAFDCALDDYRIGDRVHAAASDYQVAILGEEGGEFIDALATIRDGILVAVNDLRDNSLPLLNYHGGERGPAVAS